jgi:Zn-dependent protease with chaperone function
MIRLLREAALQLSVGPIRDLWPLLLIPAFGALVRDLALRSPAQSRMGSVAHGLLLGAPGAIALVLIAYAVVDSTPPDKALRWSALWMLAPGLGVVLLAFAAARLWTRASKIRALFKASAEPGPELAALSHELGLRIRGIESADAACFVAGFLRPTAFVSQGVIAALTEAELKAVLLHERAHVRAFDTVWLLFLSVLCDLRPVGGRRAMKAFLAGLERLADVAAVRDCAPADLASAILRVQDQRRPGGDIALAVGGSGHLRWRIDALLKARADPPMGSLALLLAAGGVMALLAWPEVQLYLHRPEGRRWTR